MELREIREGYTELVREKPFQWEEDGLKVTRTCAWSGPGCHEGCGVLLYTDQNDRLVKVEGDQEHPFNDGRLCVRCLDLTEVIYHPQRLQYPMKRAREDRGKDKFERISWDEAFDLVASTFNEIREQYGAWTVVFVDGTARDSTLWLTRLAWSFGSPNYCFHMGGMSCFGPRVAGCFATTGAFWLGDFAQQFPERYDDPRYEIPEYIVLWGCNPVVSNSDGLFGHWVTDLMKRGSKIISIDPRMTWLGSRSDEYLPIRPGTDVALAMGMMNVMIEEDIYDREFVEHWCYGFEELAEAVKEWTPEKTSETTWIPAEKIIRTARKLAAAKNWILQWGVAIDMTKETMPANQALMALVEITGDLDIPGGMIQPVTVLFYPGGWGQEWLPEGNDDKRIGLDKYGILKAGFQICSTDEIINTLETQEPYRLRAAYMQTTNFLACAGPQPQRTLKAYRTLDFIVSVDIFMTPTVMALADVVLPAATYPERNGVHCGEGIQRGEVLTKVTQTGETKSDMEINLELGKRLRPEAWPWSDDIDMYNTVLAQTGISFSEMQEAAPVFIPFEYHRFVNGKLRQDGRVGFNTPSGRIELWSSYYNNIGLPTLPYFEEPESQYSLPELAERYPYILTTGARNWPSFHSEHRQIPRLRAMRPDPLIEIHPQTAAKHGVESGDWVWVENHRGRCKRRVRVTPTLSDPRVINTDHGWWLPEAPAEEENGLFGLWDMAVNNLIPWEAGKAGFGTNYRSLICNFYKVEED
jgi:anaerobic selenocysteine-containing dehydrogenase